MRSASRLLIAVLTTSGCDLVNPGVPCDDDDGVCAPHVCRNGRCDRRDAGPAGRPPDAGGVLDAGVLGERPWLVPLARRRAIFDYTSNVATDRPDFQVPISFPADGGFFDGLGDNAFGPITVLVDGGHAVRDTEDFHPSVGATLWVRLPALVAGGANVVELYWDAQPDAGVIGTLRRDAATWAGFDSVYHLGVGNPALVPGQPVGVPAPLEPTTAYGRIGVARFFDVDHAYGLAPDGGAISAFTNAGAFTVSAWVFPQAGFSDIESIVSFHGSSAGSRFAFQVNNSADLRVLLRIPDSEAPVEAVVTGGITRGAWHHVVVVVKVPEDAVTFFIDGEKFERPVALAAEASDTTPPTLAAIGSDDNDAAEYFHGVIDELEIANTAWSDDEVLARWYIQSGAGVTRRAIETR